ncbi:MAG: prenyltransferase/squalene oxidase repeat-containing protein [Pirellulales bacterium]
MISEDEWRRVDAAAQRALRWLASQQESDGSFATLDIGQPGVTSLCVLAFMSHGQMPGQGEYGERLERAADFIVGCQKENGLVALGPDGPEISRFVAHEIGAATAYNHGISSLALAEPYGTTEGARASRLRVAIGKSLRATLLMQRWPKDRAVDDGGWRYLNDFNQEDSDLSVTGWELKFLRSARNAGFDVPKSAIDNAVGYVRRTYSERYGTFGYAAGDYYDFRSRGMAGAGILALAHAGYHKSRDAQNSGDWILQNGFDRYNEIVPFTQGWPNDRYHYGLFNCCQGMYQLGGDDWAQFYPPVVRTLLANQQADGSWPPESHFHDAQFGSTYTTALVLLTLGAPNDFLPIYQR